MARQGVQAIQALIKPTVRWVFLLEIKWLTKSILKASIAVASLHFTVAVRTKMLFLSIDSPCEVLFLKSSTTDIATSWFKHTGYEDKNNKSYDPFHIMYLF